MKILRRFIERPPISGSATYCDSHHQWCLQLMAALLLAVPSIGLADAMARTGATQEVRLPPLPNSSPILAFGDSLTAGVGGSGINYPQRLGQLTGREVINAGVPGGTSAQGRARLGDVLRDTKPGLLILCLGINDFLRRVPQETLHENLQEMVDEASTAGIPVLLLAVPSLQSHAVAPWFATLARADRVRIDLHAVVDVLRQPALKADLVHPNAEGYRLIADAVWRVLRESGALASGTASARTTAESEKNR